MSKNAKLIVVGIAASLMAAVGVSAPATAAPGNGHGGHGMISFKEGTWCC